MMGEFVSQLNCKFWSLFPTMYELVVARDIVWAETELTWQDEESTVLPALV